MTLAEKIQHLRALEGTLRGLDRPLTKSEVVRLLRQDLGESISLAYLSQLESGKRQHMTATTRDLLARFFKVHPGYLVSDPEGFRTEVTSVLSAEAQLDEWLYAGADSFSEADPELSGVLRALAGHPASRELLLLLGQIVRRPETIERLASCLQQADDAQTMEILRREEGYK